MITCCSCIRSPITRGNFRASSVRRLILWLVISRWTRAMLSAAISLRLTGAAWGVVLLESVRRRLMTSLARPASAIDHVLFEHCRGYRAWLEKHGLAETDRSNGSGKARLPLSPVSRALARTTAFRRSAVAARIRAPWRLQHRSRPIAAISTRMSMVSTPPIPAWNRKPADCHAFHLKKCSRWRP